MDHLTRLLAAWYPPDARDARIAELEAEIAERTKERDEAIRRAEMVEKALTLRLSPAARRLYLRLARGPAMTAELRQVCSIGNISQARTSLNARLAAAGDTHRVFCWVRPHTNVYGERVPVGEWHLLDAARAEDSK